MKDLYNVKESDLQKLKSAGLLTSDIIVQECQRVKSSSMALLLDEFASIDEKRYDIFFNTSEESSKAYELIYGK